MEVKSYIYEYLEEHGMQGDIREFELETINVNTLDITRTFLDKVMAVKRHACCGSLLSKVRHIYDVTALYRRLDIKAFLADTARLKELLRLTKETDSYYLQKRNLPADYNPSGPFAFDEWRKYFNDEIRRRYETLHEDLLYTSEKQNFEDAIQTFEEINQLFSEIDE